MIEARRAYIVVIDKKERVCIIKEIAAPTDRRVEEREKVEKYQYLKRERDWTNLGN